MTLRTCTKVNIGLNVLRKRPDGYHDLETLFVPYWGLGDALEIEPADELSITIEREGGVDWDPMQDLTVRAWRLLKADFPGLTPVSIRLQKGAPVGAGLGGGSADAAFMLRGLNELGSLGLSDATLASYAARLGSDCAFFVFCSPMFATGRGEILEPFDIDLSPYDLRVEIPLDPSGRPVAVSTREAYAGIVPRDNRRTLTTIPLHPKGTRGGFPLNPSVGPADLRNFAGIQPRNTRDAAPIDFVAGKGSISAELLPRNTRDAAPIDFVAGSAETSRQSALPLREALRRPAGEWRGIVVNDFEATVCPRHPQIQAKIDDFYGRGAVYAAMSGSGSAVFGLFPRK